MTLSARALAQAEQLKASDPAVSAFVGASAGSGKTKLLTDRLLRLMLAGAEPARIQCLTFTKAAAAEMSLRLNALLGEWVTLDDAALDARLAALELPPGPALRGQARALFARVLDLPGGMRIGTIHAFCQSLLRRFPLEAAISPHFQIIEEVDAAARQVEAREEAIGHADDPAGRDALETLAGLVSLDQFGDLAKKLQSDRGRLAAALALGPEGLAAAQRRALGTGDRDEAAVRADAVVWAGERAVRQAAGTVARGRSSGAAERAAQMLLWLDLDRADRVENWQEWCRLFFRKDGAPSAPRSLVSSDVQQRMPGLLDAFLAEQQRIIAVEDACRTARVAAISAALLRLAAPMAQAYQVRKQAAQLLDYEDLIRRTLALMRDPGVAWVLYKLDGGLDHLLLDEVQDTAPAQWQIAGALTEEFFAGAGARETALPRTVFAVGDRKQSIYSFQGADPEAFDHWRDELGRRVRGANCRWIETPLNVSFRSTAPVLKLVDAVFADPAARAGVVRESEPPLVHYADRADHAGSVELWPLRPAPERAEPEPWTVPDRYHGQAGAPRLLAEALAGWIAGQIRGGVMLESAGRLLHAGDVLVLVRRRTEFGRLLVRALKRRSVPVAGLDRMVLTQQPAVADLLALAEALLLPQDDLGLATVLTSPLGGLSDDSLMELAVGRPGSLWEALRRRAGERPDWRSASAFFHALLARVDYATPHALFVEALGRLGGRARLFARFGPEAAEPVDELLAAALEYARTRPPALQGFLHWLGQSGAEVKREAEGAGGAVRIMTVHGAKGLESPVVILPDTTSLPRDDGQVAWAEDPSSRISVPIWVPKKELGCAGSDAVRAKAEARRLEEKNRLLYVAMTRARDRLIVCGWMPTKSLPETCWYELVRRGFAALPEAESRPFDCVTEPWAAEMRRLASPQRAAPERAGPSVQEAASITLPAWAGGAPGWQPRPPPAEPVLPVALAPSRTDGDGPRPVPAAASPLAMRDAAALRLRRGRLLHALLQHLPALPSSEREAAARTFLARPGSGLAPGSAAALAEETMAILGHPELAPLFGPGSRAEVPLTGVVHGSVVGGLVDRLAVLADRILVADYKTDREPPKAAEATPVLYLRQMAAYRAVLARIYPDRPVRCAVIWTQAARVDWLAAELLDRHAPGAGADA
ncbi:MAG: double-strand break repair helicase AddA [Acidisphaera sp.]|nr:double-strand break repair helicase AddA [Acidisphaera sp.]